MKQGDHPSPGCQWTFVSTCHRRPCLLCQQTLRGKTLGDLSVPVEMAEDLLRTLANRFEGHTLSELLSSQVYAKYRLPAEELSSSLSSRSHCRTPDPGEDCRVEASSSEDEAEPHKAKAELPEAETRPAKAKAKPLVAQSDSQLFNHLLVTEGMTLPPEVKTEANGESNSGGGVNGPSCWTKPWMVFVAEIGYRERRGVRSPCACLSFDLGDAC